MGTGVSSSSGFTGTLNYAEFAALANPNAFTGTQCKASAGGGTRQAVVAAGTARVQHILNVVSGATLSLAENTSGLTRIDLVCLYVNWTAGSGAGDASLVAVTGTPSSSPVAPYASLSVTPGTAWHEPIAEVTVASGAGVLSASAVQDVRQGPWIAMTLTSPWVNYGAPYATAQFRATPTDVYVNGLVKGGPARVNPSSPNYDQVASPLPKPFRPAANLHFATALSAGGITYPGVLQVTSAGQVWVRTLGPNYGTANWFTLQCSYPKE